MNRRFAIFEKNVIDVEKSVLAELGIVQLRLPVTDLFRICDLQTS